MATFYSNQATKINNLTTGTYAAVPTDELAGRLRVAYFSYSFAGTEATNDTIRLTKVPAGARILGLTYYNEDCGTTVTADFGDAGDVDRFLASVALGTVSSAQVYALLRQSTENEGESTPITLGYGYKYTTETWLDIFLSSVSTPTANATVRGHFTYVVD